MGNPYKIIFSCLPEDCARIIFSFYRPKHPNSIIIREKFYYCFTCKTPLKSRDSKIKFCKSRHYPKYIFCNIDDFIFCEDCPPYEYVPLNLI